MTAPPLAPRPHTPAQAWAELSDGNARFVAGTPLHPNQDAARRQELAGGQRPFATFFGCSDSRVAAEVIFDRGLGDLFVVRTAGHVVDTTSLGSLEFGAQELDVPLIVVLGHDSCGAIAASIRAFEEGSMPPGFMRDLVERVTPSVTASFRAHETAPDEVGREHVRQTVTLLQDRSRCLAERIADGRLAIVGLTYTLTDGRARVVASAGDLTLQ
ncbi:carbonic anhydrase [Agilicoccus flavus]|uniref:carbonic anhydrase n=1 Tax=Agilicoccus flavus TaxID=2775968 RepID=UPI001CF64600|nr:carbonic anhydrase [Agilicoccus flavus]